MRKIFPFLFFISASAAVFAAPFGSLVGPDEIRAGSHKSQYLIDKIADGQPVYVCVDGRLDKYSLSAGQIDAALNSWFKYAYRSIFKAKRRTEFKDILPILSKGADIRLQNCENNAFFNRQFADQIKNGSLAADYAYAPAREDLRLILADETDLDDGRSYFSEGTGSASYIVWDAQDKSGKDGLDVLRHELGHALALSDQYMENRQNSHPAYGTSDMADAMMNSADGFTCDDADGLIFAIDCIAQKNPARGGQTGWRSFCPQRAGRNYAYCKTKNREDLLWVSDDLITYARYNQAGDLTFQKEWERVRDGRLFSLYPQGIPPLPDNLTTVYKGKYVSYKKDGEAEYLFSTRSEPGEMHLEPGQMLVVRANPHYSVVLIKGKNGITLPLGNKKEMFDLSLEKKGREINASTQTKISQKELYVLFSYTPNARFEYYSSVKDGEIIFMFPKNSSDLYVFFSPDIIPRVRPAQGARAKLPPDEDGFPPRGLSPITAAEARPFTDKPVHDERYTFDDTPLPENFLFRHPLGQDAWDLHKRWRAFFEGTAKNWMPGAISDGFAAGADSGTKNSAGVRGAVSARMRKK